MVALGLSVVRAVSVAVQAFSGLSSAVDTAVSIMVVFAFALRRVVIPLRRGLACGGKQSGGKNGGQAAVRSSESLPEIAYGFLPAHGADTREAIMGYVVRPYQTAIIGDSTRKSADYTVYMIHAREPQTPLGTCGGVKQ